MRLFYAIVLTVLAALPARAEVDIQEVTSPGGITAWLVEEHSIPFVALDVRFRGGASLDAPEKRGAINLMTGLLVSERWYQELPDELRSMLDEELKKAGDEATQMTVDAQADVRKEMEEAGVVFAEVDTELFSSQMQAVYDDMGWTELREQLEPVLSAGE